MGIHLPILSVWTPQFGLGPTNLIKCWRKKCNILRWLMVASHGFWFHGSFWNLGDACVKKTMKVEENSQWTMQIQSDLKELSHWWLIYQHCCCWCYSWKALCGWSYMHVNFQLEEDGPFFYDLELLNLKLIRQTKWPKSAFVSITFFF